MVLAIIRLALALLESAANRTFLKKGAPKTFPKSIPSEQLKRKKARQSAVLSCVYEKNSNSKPLRNI